MASQVQAFLEASEDVDVDAETIEDILQALIHREDVEDAEARSETQMDEDEISDGELEPSTQDCDISPLFEANYEGFLPLSAYVSLIYVSQATETWSKQEVKQMLHLLKERG